jgi:hypothetical protein
LLDIRQIISEWLDNLESLMKPKKQAATTPIIVKPSEFSEPRKCLISLNLDSPGIRLLSMAVSEKERQDLAILMIDTIHMVCSIYESNEISFHTTIEDVRIDDARVSEAPVGVFYSKDKPVIVLDFKQQYNGVSRCSLSIDSLILYGAYDFLTDLALFLLRSNKPINRLPSIGVDTVVEEVQELCGPSLLIETHLHELQVQLPSPSDNNEILTASLECSIILSILKEYIVVGIIPKDIQLKFVAKSHPEDIVSWDRSISFLYLVEPFRAKMDYRQNFKGQMDIILQVDPIQASCSYFDFLYFQNMQEPIFHALQKFNEQWQLILKQSSYHPSPISTSADEVALNDIEIREKVN